MVFFRSVPCGRKQPFRVPLYAEYRQTHMLNSFNCAVLRGLNDFQESAGNIHTLMVGTVYKKTLTVKLIKDGAGKCMGEMKLIPFPVFMETGGWKLLPDTAAEENIN